MSTAKAPEDLERWQDDRGASPAAAWDARAAALCVGLAMRPGESAFEVGRFSTGLTGLVGKAAPRGAVLQRAAGWSTMKTLLDFGLRLDDGVAARFPVFIDDVDRDVVVDALPLALWFSEKPLTFQVRRLDSVCGRGHPLGALILDAPAAARATLRGAREAIRSREPIVLVRADAGGTGSLDLLGELRDLAPYEAVEPWALPSAAGKGPAAAAVFSTASRAGDLARAGTIARSLMLGEPIEWTDTLSRSVDVAEAFRTLRHRNARVIQPDAFVATDGLYAAEQDGAGRRWRWGGARPRISICFEPETPGWHRIDLTIDSAVQDRLARITLVAVNGRPTPYAISGSTRPSLSLVAALPDPCVIQIGCEPISGPGGRSPRPQSVLWKGEDHPAGRARMTDRDVL